MVNSYIHFILVKTILTLFYITFVYFILLDKVMIEVLYMLNVNGKY